MHTTRQLSNFINMCNKFCDANFTYYSSNRRRNFYMTTVAPYLSLKFDKVVWISSVKFRICG